jgi:hypothetical protein
MSGNFVPDFGFGLNCINDGFFGGLYAGINFENSHKMTETFFLFESFEDFDFFILRQHSIGGELNDVNFTEEVSFVLFVDFPFTNEDMKEAFFNEHVEDVVFFVFKKESDETAEELGFLDGFEDFLAGDRYAMAEDFQELVLVQSQERNFHDFVEGDGEKVAQTNDHGLGFETLKVFRFFLRVSLVSVERRKAVVIDE